MNKPNAEPLKSWFRGLYPLHECSDCGLEHVRIPNLEEIREVEGHSVKMTYVPYELVGTVDGPVRSGANMPPLDTPARVYVLFWGAPGAQKPAATSFVYMN
jgi:hypothetical protein